MSEADKQMNNYLIEVVKNNTKCQGCEFRFENNTCFFAYDCIMKNQCHFREENKWVNTLKQQ